MKSSFVNQPSFFSGSCAKNDSFSGFFAKNDFDSDIHLIPSFGFSSSLEMNDSASKIDKAFISFGYSKEKGEMLGIRGIYDREVTFLETSSWIVSPTKIKQAELIMNWPISDSISLFGRFNKDFDINKSLDLSYGFEYSNCCLKVGLMKRKWIEERMLNTDLSPIYEKQTLALQQIEAGTK